MSYGNVPDDWGCYYRKCGYCGQTYHESEGGCYCLEYGDCTCCGGETDNLVVEPSYDNDPIFVCDSCFYCEYCGEYFGKDQLATTKLDIEICEDCYKTESVECDYCGEKNKPEDMIRDVGSKMIPIKGRDIKFEYDEKVCMNCYHDDEE